MKFYKRDVSFVFKAIFDLSCDLESILYNNVTDYITTHPRPYIMTKRNKNRWNLCWNFIHLYVN